MKQKPTSILIFLGGFLGGIIIGLALGDIVVANDSYIKNIFREKSRTYEFIRPLLGFETAEEGEFERFNPLHEELTSYIQNQMAIKKASMISVYLRDLNSGAWMGINENEEYAPASMLKVLTMIGFFKVAEEKPEILSKELYYDGLVDRNDWTYYQPSQSLGGGKFYTVSSLIERMIIHSGNNSYYLLENFLRDEVTEDLYIDFRLPSPQSPFDIDFMSAKSFSFIFRVLYNSTYLSRNMSERALKLLSKTEFDKGLAADLPASIAVSHKFGERTYPANGTEMRELHDCGIVFHPRAPYFLCVMTKGSAFPALEKSIAEISRRIYRRWESL